MALAILTCGGGIKHQMGSYGILKMPLILDILKLEIKKHFCIWMEAEEGLVRGTGLAMIVNIGKLSICPIVSTVL